MRIGFVSTWFERGASYVTKAYIDLLKSDHDIFVYARGGEEYAKGDSNWDFTYVTWGPKLRGTSINFKHFENWIKKKKLDIIFFNEQNEISIVYKVKKKYPNIKLGSYIDYYKENTIKEFYLYDFLICNTKRHAFVFKDHPQSYYVPWGTDINLFKPAVMEENKLLTFFHSAGMSDRKGTSFVIDAFIKGEIFKKAKLIIHTQKSNINNLGYKLESLKEYNIEIIEETVAAPGLYYLGDVYVYPTMLEGLGLTMYEALACGLPVIATNHPPMNEVINEEVGRLVEVDYLRCRADAYYWPLAITNLDSLINAMNYYYENRNLISSMKKRARKEVINNWNWKERQKEVNKIFVESLILLKEDPHQYIAHKNMFERLKTSLGSSYLYRLKIRLNK